MNNENCSASQPPHVSPQVWKEMVREFQKPSLPRALWQVVNTVGLYFLTWYFIYLSLSISWWLTAPLIVLAGGLLVRVFIIFHDCGHGSFFKSPNANHFLGFITGMLTFTPYFHWRWEHSVHHASSGHLDERGMGDIWTMTVQEYLEAGRWKRFAYRLARNPIVLFGLAPLALFIVLQRFPKPQANVREKYSVYWMNACLVAMTVGMSLIFGVGTYIVLQLLITLVAGSAGIWMFYIQHQFEDVYWERAEKWDYTAAALQGSSFYKLPRLLQWFTGNIGYHHIHHLSPRIPNYNLQRCHEAHELFQQVKPITFFSSLKSISYRLFDEKNRRLIGYRELRQILKQQKVGAR